MAEFNAKPLNILDKLYRFVGGTRGVSRMDLGSAITLVHDVSRQAENAGLGPYFGRCEYSATLSVAGAGTDTEVLSLPTDIAAIFNIQEDEWDLYTMGISFQSQITDLGDISHIAAGHGYANGTVGRAVTKYGSDGDIYEPFFGISGTDFHNFMRADANTSYAAYYWRPDRPARAPDKGFIGLRLDTTAAAQIRFRWEIWIGPRGAKPPGVG